MPVGLRKQRKLRSNPYMRETQSQALRRPCVLARDGGSTFDGRTDNELERHTKYDAESELPVGLR